MPTVSVKGLSGDGSPANDTSQEVQPQVGMSLWELLNEEGITLNHGCLNGACAACRVEILEGEDFLTPMGHRETETLKRFKESHEMRFGAGSLDGKGIRLSCQAKIKKEGNISLKPAD